MADGMEHPEAAFLYSAGIFPWWLILLWGVLTLFIGALFLAAPLVTAEVLIMFLGAFWLAGGLFSLGSLVADRTNMNLKIFLAAINILAGVLILVYPVLATVFVLSLFVILLGFFACFIGCSHLYAAFKNRDAGNGVLGIISLVFGILLLAFPLLSAAIIPFLAGAFCIASGISALFAAFAARRALASRATP